MKEHKNIQHFINEIRDTPNLPIDLFIEEFCEVNQIELADINKYKGKVKGSPSASGTIRNNFNIHCSMCKFLLFWCIRHKYVEKYKERDGFYPYEKIAKEICPDSPVRRPTAYYCVSMANDFLLINDKRFRKLYDTTISNLYKFDISNLD